MTNSWSLLYDELTMDEYPYPEIKVSQKTTTDYGLDEYPYPDYTELPTNQTIDDGMRPWGHSDHEFLINVPDTIDIVVAQNTIWKNQSDPSE